MIFNEAGIKLIKEFEGCAFHAYTDLVGKLTIGYGSTRDVQDGLTITQEEADRRLFADIGYCGGLVSHLLGELALTDNQYSAIVCIGFNIGIGNLSTSTLLKKVIESDFTGASEEFEKWDHVTVNGVKTEVSGLLRRRRAEKELFLAESQDQTDNKT